MAFLDDSSENGKMTELNDCEKFLSGFKVNTDSESNKKKHTLTPAPASWCFEFKHNMSSKQVLAYYPD